VNHGFLRSSRRHPTQKLPDGANYQVTILGEPAGEACTITSASGTVTGDVTGVAVTCSPILYTVGGMLRGLKRGKSVTLQNRERPS
jgi:hypothetical protein